VDISIKADSICDVTVDCHVFFIQIRESGKFDSWPAVLDSKTNIFTHHHPCIFKLPTQVDSQIGFQKV